jgi:hypothetical protein
MEITKVSAHKFLVQSESSEGQYKVVLSGESKGTISCTCRAFIFKRTCKHIDGVRELLKREGKTVKVKKLVEHFEFIEPYKMQLDKISQGALYSGKK